MSPRKASLLALLALAACDDIDVEPTPRPDRPVLSAGAYVMVVEDVAELSCDMPRSELVGQRLGARVAVEGDALVLDMDGWILRGEMAPGHFFVEGTDETMGYHPTEDDVGYEDEDVDHGGDPGDEGADEGGGEMPPYDTDCDESFEDCGETPSGDPPEERPDDRPDDRPRAYASIDGRILDADRADGRLTIEMPGCEMALAITLSAAEDLPTEPPEERPDERPPEEPGEDRPDEGEGRSEEGEVGVEE